MGPWSLRQSTFPESSERLFFCMADLSGRISVEYAGSSVSPRIGVLHGPLNVICILSCNAWASSAGEQHPSLGPSRPQTSFLALPASLSPQSCGVLAYSSPGCLEGSLEEAFDFPAVLGFLGDLGPEESGNILRTGQEALWSLQPSL